jgi:hypothetical protein
MTEGVLREWIDAAEEVGDLERLGHCIDRHYDAGTITAKGLARLDVRIMERLALFDADETARGANFDKARAAWKAGQLAATDQERGI